MEHEKSSEKPQRSPYAMVFGGRSERARTVLVYGNCQAGPLALALSAIDDLNDDYRFVVAFNHPVPGELTAPCIPDEDLKDVALVLRQVEDRTTNPALEVLTSRLPASCPVIRYPTFMLFCGWPFECMETRERHDPSYPVFKRYPYGDMLALQIAESGLTGPLAVAAYMDLSYRKMPNMQVRLERDIARMQHYDALSDVKLSDYVLERFRDEHLFWTSGHVSGKGVAELARRVAEQARPVLGGSAARAEACLAAGAVHWDMGGHQNPIHPLVAESLQLRFWQADATYRWETQQWNFYEYIQRNIEYDTSW